MVYPYLQLLGFVETAYLMKSKMLELQKELLAQVNNKKIAKIFLNTNLSIFDETFAPIPAVNILVIDIKKTIIIFT